MSRNRNKKFVTAFTIVMIVFTIGLSIPSIIEGINIGQNIQSYDIRDREIEAGKYDVLKWSIESSAKISGNIDCQNDTYSYFDEENIVFAIMSETEYTAWYDLGENKPSAINCTYYFEQNDIRFQNIEIDIDTEYYLVFFNDNSYTVYVDADLNILPWGHIIATSIVGFGFAICFLGLLTKIGFTTYFVLSEDKKPKVLTVESQNRSEPVLQPEMDENFCVSCGAVMTKKDGRYCSNCGSSI